MATVMRDTLSIDVERSNINNGNMSEEATTPTSPQSVGMPVRKQPEMLYLPNTLADWPWPRSLNPHYDEVGQQSREWLRSFNAFPAKAQNAFDACDFNLLASLAYPRHSKDHVRIGCDVMNLFFVIEEYTDDATTEQTTRVVDMVMDALRHPHAPRPEEEKRSCLAGEVSRQFWENAVRTASNSTQARFVGAFDAYTQAVIREAEDRNTHVGHIEHSIDSYLQLRRQTIGCWPSFALLGLNTEYLTDNVTGHPLVQALGHLATELILMGNDLVSYNRERKDGALHNLVTIVHSNPPSTHPYISTPQEALDWIFQYHDVLAKHFVLIYDAIKYMFEPGAPHHAQAVRSSAGSAVLPVVDTTMTTTLTLVANSTESTQQATFSDEEKVALLDYVDGLGNWVRANDQWSFESLRYFGKDGLEVQKSRLVEMRPVGKPPQ